MRGLPINPYNNSSRVRIDGEKPGANTAGWRMNSETGAIWPDHSGIDEDVPEEDLGTGSFFLVIKKGEGGKSTPAKDVPEADLDP